MITGSELRPVYEPRRGRALAPLAGPHTYGVLWSTTGVTFVYDGVVVGSANVTLTGPMYLAHGELLGFARRSSASPWTCATCGCGSDDWKGLESKLR